MKTEQSTGMSRRSFMGGLVGGALSLILPLYLAKAYGMTAQGLKESNSEIIGDNPPLSQEDKELIESLGKGNPATPPFEVDYSKINTVRHMDFHGTVSRKTLGWGDSPPSIKVDIFDDPKNHHIKNNLPSTTLELLLPGNNTVVDELQKEQLLGTIPLNRHTNFRVAIAKHGLQPECYLTRLGDHLDEGDYLDVGEHLGVKFESDVHEFLPPEQAPDFASLIKPGLEPARIEDYIMHYWPTIREWMNYMVGGQADIRDYIYNNKNQNQIFVVEQVRYSFLHPDPVKEASWTYILIDGDEKSDLVTGITVGFPGADVIKKIKGILSEAYHMDQKTLLKIATESFPYTRAMYQSGFPDFMPECRLSEFSLR